MKEIDLSKYERIKHFNTMMNYDYPFVGVNVDVEITDLLEAVNKFHLSFYMTFVHCVALAANNVREFRLRIIDGKIYEFDECPTSHIELLENNTYVYCFLHHNMDIKEYVRVSELRRKEANEKKELVEEEKDYNSLLFISCMPWVSFTSIVQPTINKYDCIPRFMWGKYRTSHNKVIMPVNVMAHHALVDGVHIGMFYKELDKQIKLVTKEINENL